MFAKKRIQIHMCIKRVQIHACINTNTNTCMHKYKLQARPAQAVERRVQLRFFKQAAGLKRAQQFSAFGLLQYLNAHK